MNFNRDDMNRYISGTIINFKGSFLYVTGVEDTYMTCVSLEHAFSSERTETCRVSFDNSFTTIFTLGYMNTENGAVYIRRTPGPDGFGGRYYKQGLHLNMMTPRIHRNQMLPLEQCLRNDYPNLDCAFLTAVEKSAPIAFHKKYAIDHNRRVYAYGMLAGSLQTPLDDLDMSVDIHWIGTPTEVFKQGVKNAILSRHF